MQDDCLVFQDLILSLGVVLVVGFGHLSLAYYFALRVWTWEFRGIWLLNLWSRIIHVLSQEPGTVNSNCTMSLVSRLNRNRCIWLNASIPFTGKSLGGFFILENPFVYSLNPRIFDEVYSLKFKPTLHT